MRTSHIFSVACLALQYFFSTSSQNGTIFGKKLMNVKCVFRIYLLIMANAWSLCVSKTVQVRIVRSRVLRVSLDNSNI